MSELHDRPFLQIDPDFHALCPPLAEDEKSGLIAMILKEGCRDPIMYWVDPEGKWLIVDGHNRYEICIAHGLWYETRPLEVKTRAEVLQWIWHNQLYRRNMTPQVKNLTIAKLAMMLAKEGCDTMSQSERVVSKLSKNPPRTKHIAEKTGVTRRTVQRATAFDKDMEKLAAKSPTLHDAAMGNKISIRDVAALADAPDAVLRSLEETPEDALRASARSVAQEVKAHKPLKAGRAVMDLRCLDELEKQMGKVTRCRSASLQECQEMLQKGDGGMLEKAIVSCGEPYSDELMPYYDSMRHSLCAIFDEIAALRAHLREILERKAA
jgi:hypothetical protein